jgi:acyl-CoA thioesterase-1
MRSVFIVAICFLAIFLDSSCGNSHQEERKAAPAGSMQPAESSPAQPPLQQEDNGPLVVAFGDSLTQGVSGKSYPAYLQDVLDENGYRYRVENQGVSGDTTSDGLVRLENVIAQKPALVILEFGGNDGLRGIPVEETKKNLGQMIEQLRAAKIPVVLAGITLPPNYGPDYVKPFTAMYPELAKKYRLRFLPFLLIHVYDKPNLMQPDGIHPSERGNKIVAQDVFELIRPMLKQGHAVPQAS